MTRGLESLGGESYAILAEFRPVDRGPRSSALIAECYEPLAMPIFVAISQKGC